MKLAHNGLWRGSAGARGEAPQELVGTLRRRSWGAGLGRHTCMHRCMHACLHDPRRRRSTCVYACMAASSSFRASRRLPTQASSISAAAYQRLMRPPAPALVIACSLALIAVTCFRLSGGTLALPRALVAGPSSSHPLAALQWGRMRAVGGRTGRAGFAGRELCALGARE